MNDHFFTRATAGLWAGSVTHPRVPPWRTLAVWLLLLLCVPCVHALEFSYTHPFSESPQTGATRSLTISGDLRPGDTARLVALMRSRPADTWHALGRVELKISGGDQREALLMAETLAGLYPHMVAGPECAGACAIVWLSGAWRLLPQGRIGLQTPTPQAPVDDTTARPLDAPPAFDPLPAQLRAYALKQGLSMPLTERWLSGSGGQLHWLSRQEVNATGIWPPYYYEKLSAQCPPLDASDPSFHALRRCAARLVISQKAFAFDKLLGDVNDPWWNQNRNLFRNAPR